MKGGGEREIVCEKIHTSTSLLALTKSFFKMDSSTVRADSSELMV